VSIRTHTQEDPIGLAGGLNLYGFAGGDPINFSDPFGLCPGGCVLEGSGVVAAGLVLLTATTAILAGDDLADAIDAGIQAGRDFINGARDLSSRIFRRGKDLPAQGEPNSTDVRDDGEGGGQIRDYGADGKAKTDYDFGHDHTGAGDPHAHDWDWTQTPPRQPPRPIRPNETPPTGGNQ